MSSKKMVKIFNEIFKLTFQFEFVTSGDGVFEIHAKFMGVRLEHVEVDIQVR